MVWGKLELKAVARGIVAYVLFYGFSMLVLAVLGNSSRVTTSGLFFLNMAFAVVGCFAAGYIAGRHTRDHAAFNGLTVGGAGATLMVAYLLLQAGLPGSETPDRISLPFLFMLVTQSCVICCLAGVLGHSRSRPMYPRDVQ